MLTYLNSTYSLPPKGSIYPNQARRGLFHNDPSLNDFKLITALYYHIRLVRIPLLVNFTGKVVLTSSAKYTKILSVVRRASSKIVLNDISS